jgi:Fe-S-cluster containining protein
MHQDPARLSSISDRLEVIESCEGCGVCCQVVTHPPFYSVFHEVGEDAWERLKIDRPDLLAALLADYHDRRASGRPLTGTRCIWFDGESGRCLHYEYRPLACREFEVGGEDCRDARRRAGIGDTPGDKHAQLYAHD